MLLAILLFQPSISFVILFQSLSETIFKSSESIHYCVIFNTSTSVNQIYSKHPTSSFIHASTRILTIQLNHISTTSPLITYNPFFITMKPLLVVLLAFLGILGLVHSQNAPPTIVSDPFPQPQPSQPIGHHSTRQIDIQTEPIQAPKKHHGKKKHEKRVESEQITEVEEPQYWEELTQQEREERRMERHRYNKIFRWGMLAGISVLAIVLCRFCAAKRRRRCQMMQQRQQAQQIHMQPQHIHMQPQQIHMQPYVHSLSAYPYPVNQPVQNPRPYYPQPQPARPQTHPKPAQPQIVRGRPHDSILREQSHPIQDQIKYHENMLNGLKEQKRREESESRRRMAALNTTESIEESIPIRRNKVIPVGQPIYERDANSSFASEYPEI